jgi:hypothetical protein
MLTMTGSSDFLKLAPEVLVIPLNGSKNSNAQLLDDAHVGRGRGPTKEEKIATLVHGASHVVTTKTSCRIWRPWRTSTWPTVTWIAQ